MSWRKDWPRKLVRELWIILWKEHFHRALVIFGLSFWFMTSGSEYPLWPFFALIEICYVTYSFNNGPLSRLLRRVKWEAVAWLLFPLLIWLFETQAEKIVIFGHPFSGLYEKWEIVALTWNVVFFFLSYLLVPMPKSGAKILALVLLGAGIHLAWKAIAALEDNRFSDHLELIFWISACEIVASGCYIVADLRNYKKVQDEGTHRMKTLLYVNLPTTLAVGCLWKFNASYPNLDEMPGFLSGAIAFQFIASSLVFAIIEGEVFEAIVEKNLLGNLTDAVIKRHHAIFHEKPPALPEEDMPELVETAGTPEVVLGETEALEPVPPVA
jgi:hypothetical protein